MSDPGAALSGARGRRELRALAASLTFLTRVPLAQVFTLDAGDIARSGPGFPLVGAGVGALLGGTTAALSRPLSPLLAAVLGLALATVVTGALHLDALADTADALGAGPRALDVMRDHAVGAYGATAVALDLLIKAAALSALAEHDRVLVAAVAAGALSRVAPVLLAAWLPYARTRGGTGEALTHGSRPRALVSLLFSVGLAAGVAGADGLVLAVATLLVVATLGFAFRAWLGGVTGDTLGAASELTELLVLTLGVGLVAS